MMLDINEASLVDGVYDLSQRNIFCVRSTVTAHIIIVCTFAIEIILEKTRRRRRREMRRTENKLNVHLTWWTVRLNAFRCDVN